MRDDDDSAAWAQQELCERQQFEEEQALLLADAGYLEWLEQLDAMRRYEQERIYGIECV